MFSKPIICSQPRPIAAISLAERVAFEYSAGVSRSKYVGYNIGRKCKLDAKTRVIYTTDSSFASELLEMVSKGVKVSSKYGAVVVDEVHERKIDTDIILGILKTQLPKDKDLRVIVTSATLDINKMCNFFGVQNSVSIPGRTFPVKYEYLPVTKNDNLVLKCAKVAAIFFL